MSPKVAKFLRGAAIAAAGAALAYISGTVIPSLEVDGTGATVVALLSIATNGLWQLVRKLEPEAPKPVQ